MNEKKRLTYSGYISIAVAAALWGVIGIWSRNLANRGLSPVSVVVIRNFGGMVCLAAFFLMRNARAFCIRPGHLKYFFGTGVVSVLLFTLCYFSCQQVCSLSVASILLYTAPAIVLLLSAVIWREGITRQKAMALILTLLGCAFVCGVFGGSLSVTAPGILLGLGAGFFYAMYSIFSRMAIQHGYAPTTITIWTFIFSGLFSLLLIRPHELVPVLAAPEAWPSILGLVVLSTALPFYLYTRSLRYVDTGTAAIMACLEPVIASLTGVVVFGETISGAGLIGIACVLAGVYILK